MHRTAHLFALTFSRLMRSVALALILVGAALASQPAQAQSHSRAEIEILAEYYANFYGVPLALVRRVINRESTFNPSARNGPYWGLMQILPATARTMGYRGSPEGLLNAETNLIYAVRYLRGAWLLAGGSHDRAVQLYAAGYYYHARDAGLLEQTALRAGPNTPPLPQPVGVAVAVASVGGTPAPQPAEDGDRPRTLMALFSGDDQTNEGAAPAPQQPLDPAPALVASVQPDGTIPDLEPEPEPAEIAVAVALDAPPPRRPEPLEEPDAVQVALAEVETETPAMVASAALADEPAGESAVSDALLALAAVSPVEAATDPAMEQLERGLEWASAYAELRPAFVLDDEDDLFEATFAQLDPVEALMVQSDLVAGADGFAPPRRP